MQQAHLQDGLECSSTGGANRQEKAQQVEAGLSSGGHSDPCTMMIAVGELEGHLACKASPFGLLRTAWGCTVAVCLCAVQVSSHKKHW